jgi:membrane-associated PAP2 superfamily phosphatase
MHRTATPATPRFTAPFLLVHALLIPGATVLAALAAHSTGFDERVSALFFDPVTGTFPAHFSPMLEVIGHRFAKSAVVAIWLTLLGAGLAGAFVGHLIPHRALLWTTIAAMALGPSIVVALKDINAYHCPWDLKRFGGYADFASAWFVSAADVGRCFPSGHAAGGFSLIALAFAGLAMGNWKLRSTGLIAALVVGSAFSVVRIAQGAHFLSHNLWSAAIDWCAAALVFAPLLNKRLGRRKSPSTGTQV